MVFCMKTLRVVTLHKMRTWGPEKSRVITRTHKLSQISYMRQLIRYHHLTPATKLLLDIIKLARSPAAGKFPSFKTNVVYLQALSTQCCIRNVVDLLSSFCCLGRHIFPPHAQVHCHLYEMGLQNSFAYVALLG